MWATPAFDAARVDAWIDTRSTRRNSAAFAGLGCGVPTRCTSVEPGGIDDVKLASSSALPTTFTARAGSFASDPAVPGRARRIPVQQRLGQRSPKVAGSPGDEN